jgi:hypothetical protein
MIRARTPAMTIPFIHFSRVDLSLDDRELLVQADDVLARAVDLVPHLREPAGLLRDALQPVGLDDQALGRGARFSSEAPASFNASYNSTSIALISDLGMMAMETASIKHSARSEGPTVWIAGTAGRRCAA